MTVTLDSCPMYTWYGYDDVYVYTMDSEEPPFTIHLCANEEKGLWLLNGLTNAEVVVNGPFKNNEETVWKLDRIIESEEVDMIIDEREWMDVVRCVNDEGEVSVFCNGMGIMKKM